MRLFALDPGSAQSGFIVLTAESGAVVAHGIAPNDIVLDLFRGNDYEADVLVYEAIVGYGMPVGREVFDTVLFTGRCLEAWHPKPAHPIERRQVKIHLCASMKAKDANVRAALLDKFGGSAAIGTKKQRGPLYGIRSHEFAALAVAVTWLETKVPL